MIRRKGGQPTGRLPRLKEADIQSACVGFLELDGWRALRTDPCSDKARATGFGTKGMADHLFMRLPVRPDYVEREHMKAVQYACAFPYRSVKSRASCVEVMWIEFKRPGTKAAKHQLDWHLAERIRGFLTLIAGLDFEPTYDGFVAWYRQSGLLRRPGL